MERDFLLSVLGVIDDDDDGQFDQAGEVGTAWPWRTPTGTGSRTERRCRRGPTLWIRNPFRRGRLSSDLARTGWGRTCPQGLWRGISLCGGPVGQGDQLSVQKGKGGVWLRLEGMRLCRPRRFGFRAWRAMSDGSFKHLRVFVSRKSSPFPFWILSFRS